MTGENFGVVSEASARRLPTKEPKEVSAIKASSKVAPRSGDQFKIGPGFSGTASLQKVVISSTKEYVKPLIYARIDRGFDMLNGEWVGYKRNYFTLVASFNFENHDLDTISMEKFLIQDEYNRYSNLAYFAIRLGARSQEDNLEVPLVQHTAKRDKGPQTPPPIYPAIPGKLPDHQLIRKTTNIRNESKISSLNQLLFSDFSEFEYNANSILQTYPRSTKAATAARYERIQFSSFLNVKKPTLTSRHFILRVVLVGYFDDGTSVDLAYTQTPPLTIRGRSPSNYLNTSEDAQPTIKKLKPRDNSKNNSLQRENSAKGKLQDPSSQQTKSFYHEDPNTDENGHILPSMPAFKQTKSSSEPFLQTIDDSNPSLDDYLSPDILDWRADVNSNYIYTQQPVFSTQGYVSRCDVLSNSEDQNIDLVDEQLFQENDSSKTDLYGFIPDPSFYDISLDSNINNFQLNTEFKFRSDDEFAIIARRKRKNKIRNSKKRARKERKKRRQAEVEKGSLNLFQRELDSISHM